jgi:hypothetical protein
MGWAIRLGKNHGVESGYGPMGPRVTSGKGEVPANREERRMREKLVKEAIRDAKKPIKQLRKRRRKSR